MKIIIKTKNLELTDSLESLVNKRMAGLEKFANVLGGASSSLFVEVEKETQHHKKGDIFTAEVLIQLPGKNLMAKSSSDSLIKSITMVRDELKIEIRKHKTKTIEIPRRRYRKNLYKTQN